MRQLLMRVLHLRLPGLLGFGLITAGLFQYKSFENREVFGCWSLAYTAVLAVASALLVFLTLRCWIRARTPGRSTSMPTALLDLAILAWGLGYLLSALDSPETGARMLDGNVVGSVVPAAALLEWTAMSLALSAAALLCSTRTFARGKSTLLSVGTLLVLFVAGEGALRLRAAVAPQTQGFPTYTDRAWERRHVTLNSEGFRDHEHGRSAPAATRRLLLVGDSCGFGTGIERLEDRFGEQLAAELTESTGTRWESINAARPDSHTLDELAFLDHMLAYDPDLVVLLYVFNDLDYLAPLTRRPAVADHPSSLLDRLRPTRLLFQNSYVFQELYVRLRLARFALAEPTGVDAYENEHIVSWHIDDLRRFVTLARNSGAAVVIVPFELTVMLGERYLERYGDFLARLGDARLPTVDLARAFAGHAYAELTVNRLDRHPNPLANRLAAHATTRQMIASPERYLPAE